MVTGNQPPTISTDPRFNPQALLAQQQQTRGAAPGPAQPTQPTQPSSSVEKKAQAWAMGAQLTADFLPNAQLIIDGIREWQASLNVTDGYITRNSLVNAAYGGKILTGGDAIYTLLGLVQAASSPNPEEAVTKHLEALYQRYDLANPEGYNNSLVSRVGELGPSLLSQIDAANNIGLKGVVVEKAPEGTRTEVLPNGANVTLGANDQIMPTDQPDVFMIKSADGSTKLVQSSVNAQGQRTTVIETHLADGSKSSITYGPGGDGKVVAQRTEGPKAFGSYFNPEQFAQLAQILDKQPDLLPKSANFIPQILQKIQGTLTQ